MNRLAKVAAAFVLTSALASPAGALLLDEDKNFKFTGVFYTQTRFRLQDSKGPFGPQTQPFYGGGTPLNTQIGNLVQWRNFAAPVFEGNLARALDLAWIDDLSFRFVGRFTYDAVFDVGPSEFRQALRLYKVSATSPAPDGTPPGLGGNQPVPIFQGTEHVESEQPGGFGADPVQRARRLADQELFDSRETFGRQYEAWEAYVNVQRGPLFMRVGRQNLSWGETDGLRLLDVINPIDNFFGLTFDEDLDEKRIPLWMLRVNYQLIDVLGPLSSFGIETFAVPGVVDVEQGPIPYQGFLHPYAPPTGCDAQLIADNSVAAPIVGASNIPNGCRNALPPGHPARGSVHTSLYERLPSKSWHNSRYGARFVGVFLNDYTFSLGAYRTWADQPAPAVHFLDTVVTPVGIVIPRTPVIELTHGTETIIGGTVSFFQQYLLPGVVRTEVGYFLGEPATVPIANLGDGPSGMTETFVPDADYLRWVIGYDVFQLNIPWISRANNIILITQWFNSLRLSSDDRFREMVDQANMATARQLPPVLPDRPPPAPLPHDFGRYALVANPGRAGKVILPAVANRYNGVWSVAVQAYMMHGNLIPQIIGVAFTEGDFGFLPNVTYRFNDAVQVKVGYAGIYGHFSQLGLFRDRDQIGVRVTYLLN